MDSAGRGADSAGRGADSPGRGADSEAADGGGAAVAAVGCGEPSGGSLGLSGDRDAASGSVMYTMKDPRKDSVAPACATTGSAAPPTPFQRRTTSSPTSAQPSIVSHRRSGSDDVERTPRALSNDGSRRRRVKANGMRSPPKTEARRRPDSLTFVSIMFKLACSSGAAGVPFRTEARHGLATLSAGD